MNIHEEKFEPVPISISCRECGIDYIADPDFPLDNERLQHAVRLGVERNDWSQLLCLACRMERLLEF